MRLIAALSLFLLALPAQAAPPDATILFPSHGGSGTVIVTGPGRTLILSACHMFEGRSAQKKISIEAPDPLPGGVKVVRIRLLAVSHDADLALIELDAGPLAFVSPVAPAGFRPGLCWSVGYDEMRKPFQVRSTRILSTDSSVTWTAERPWHGRSGGALIDQRTGVLCGVVSGYTGPRDHRELSSQGKGVYASLAAVVRFMAANGSPQPSPDYLNQPPWPGRQPQLYLQPPAQRCPS